MSNTRIAEQVHGMLRWYLQENQSIEYTDAVSRYRVVQNYQMREERRDAKNAQAFDD